MLLRWTVPRAGPALGLGLGLGLRVAHGVGVGVRRRSDSVGEPESFTKVSNEEKGLRQKAKRKLDYWIRLGEPLERMAQHFSYGILLLPQKLTDKE
jgi:hypothetical protein